MQHVGTQAQPLVAEVTLTNGPGGAVLSGNTTITFTNASATFDTLELDMPGTNYELTFNI